MIHERRYIHKIRDMSMTSTCNSGLACNFLSSELDTESLSLSCSFENISSVKMVDKIREKKRFIVDLKLALKLF